MKAFLRFALLSGGGWLLDCALLLLLTHLGLALGVSNVISSVTAAITVFLVSRVLVFEAVATPALSRAALYLGYQAFSIFIASVLIVPAAGLGRWAAESAGMVVGTALASFLGKVIITPPQLVANFLVSKFLIQHFRRPSPNV